MTTQDFATDTGLVGKLFVLGSFNDHICHHLFPTVDISKQAVLRSTIVQAMKEFEVRLCYCAEGCNWSRPSLVACLLVSPHTSLSDLV